MTLRFTNAHLINNETRTDALDRVATVVLVFLALFVVAFVWMGS